MHYKKIFILMVSFMRNNPLKKDVFFYRNDEFDGCSKDPFF